MTKPPTIIEKKYIRKGARFYWNTYSDYRGVYEILAFKKDLSLIIAYKLDGKRALLKTEEISKFDDRIINNEYFWRHS